MIQIKFRLNFIIWNRINKFFVVVAQITVRSSPGTKKVDKLSVCRHCHKNCKQKSQKASSLKVQHSQSSSSRCCASISSQGSDKSESKRNRNRSENTEKIISFRQDGLEKENSKKFNNINETICSNNLNSINNNFLCKCNCTTDFRNVTQTSNEIRKEICRIVDNVNELQSIPKIVNWKHINCNCDNVPIRESKIQNLNENEYVKSTKEISNVDDWSSKLMGLSRFRATTSSVLDKDDPFKAVPTVMVVPPTPDGSFCTRIRKTYWNQQSSEQSPEDSPQDELPYQTFNNALKRYGTISSLGKSQPLSRRIYRWIEEIPRRNISIHRDIFGTMDDFCLLHFLR